MDEIKPIHQERINGWFVEVSRSGACIPVVTAVRWEPYALEQICLPNASRATVRAWVEALPQ